MATAAQRLAEYENLFQQSQQYDPSKFQQDFEKAYGEAVQYNKPLIEARERAIAQSQTLPSQLREQYYTEGAIRNPLAQEALISQRRSPISSEIGSLTDLLTARKARQQDVFASQLGAYQTAAQQAQAAAENAWRLYQDQLAREESARARVSGGSGIASLLSNLYGGQSQPVQQIDPRQGILNMIQDVAAERKSRNIEGATIDKYYQDILDTASRYNLRLNPEALWQRLGNTISVPQSLELFYR